MGSIKHFTCFEAGCFVKIFSNRKKISLRINDQLFNCFPAVLTVKSKMSAVLKIFSSSRENLFFLTYYSSSERGIFLTMGRRLKWIADYFLEKWPLAILNITDYKWFKLDNIFARFFSIPANSRMSKRNKIRRKQN